MLGQDQLPKTRWVEEVSRLGQEKQKQFLRYFNHLLEQAVRIRVIGARRFRKRAGFLPKGSIRSLISPQEAMIEGAGRATYHIERNADTKILFHALTIKLYHIIRDKLYFWLIEDHGKVKRRCGEVPGSQMINNSVNHISLHIFAPAPVL